MKKLIVLLVICVITLCPVFSVSAAEGKVTYSGNAGNFVFEPGGKHSLTDLFPNFKDVMPGDSLTQKITVKNDADNKVKVKIYLRSLGTQKDSKEFLSQLDLKIKKSQDNEMAYMFDAAANETAQLTDWVCLGTLYSGGTVSLDLTLNVPTELDNKFQNEIGYLDWEFMIKEFPIEPDDPKVPQTGDDSNIGLWFALLIASVIVLMILLFLKKHKDQDEQK